ncbi:MAG TPA: response regulator [Brevundimonas sp.]
MMATILIADDDPVLREIASEMLRSTNHAAVLAEDGLEVLRLLDGITVDVLVTDMLMPNMDGVEVIMAARAKYPALKVLAISGGGSVGASYMLHMAKVLGADAILEKPLKLDTFIGAIRDLLEDQIVGSKAA